MIDTSEWKEFMMTELGFKNHHGIRQTKASREEGTIPLLTAGKENQGVATYIGNAPSTYQDAITVDMFGNSFFHKGMYAGDDNIYFFTNADLSDAIKKYIASVLNAENTKKYAFKEQFRQPQADSLTVKLPATTDGEPDWAYMEEYMQKVENAVSFSLTKILSAQKKEKKKIDTREWGEFKIGNLFRIEPTKGKNQQMLEEGNDVPYIAASKENNGFNRMVSVKNHQEWVSKGNCLQFIHIGDAAAGHVNYIPTDFIGMSGKSSCAYNDKMNEYSGTFIANIITRLNKGKYSFKESWTGEKVTNTIIFLPVTQSGEPDWEYMEEYMKSIMNKTHNTVDNLSC